MLNLASIIEAGRASFRKLLSDPIDYQISLVMQRVLRPDSNCIDVGALNGAVLRDAVRIAPKGHHIAIEPLPQYAAHLRSHYPRVTVWNVALADQVGRAKFHYVKTNPAYSGLRKRRYDRSDEIITEIDVSISRLDDLVDEDYKCDFLKIDVEGAELGVLKGSCGVLEREKPTIVFEHGLGAADYYETKPLDIYDLLCGELQMRLFTLVGYLCGATQLDLSAFESEFYKYGSYMFVATPKQSRV